MIKEYWLNCDEDRWLRTRDIDWAIKKAAVAPKGGQLLYEGIKRKTDLYYLKSDKKKEEQLIEDIKSKQIKKEEYIKLSKERAERAEKRFKEKHKK